MSRTFVKRITHKSGKSQLFFREKDIYDAGLNGEVAPHVLKHLRGHGHDEDRDLNFKWDRIHSRAYRNRRLIAIHNDPIFLTGECEWIWFWDTDYYTEAETHDYLANIKAESDWILYEEQRRKEWAEKRENYLAMSKLNKVLATLDSDIRYSNGVDFL